MECIVGTSGFSYKPWKGTFYPSDLPDKQMLNYYGQILSGVEIDNTFYRLPKKAVLESWADQVPENFRFTIKASRRITHFARLKNADEPLSFLMSNVEVLGDRLGAVFFQLPPNLQKDVPRLEAFLDLLPAGVPTAFEFRASSWFCDEVYSVLEQRGVALCQADTDEEPISAIRPTARLGYLRLRREEYDDAYLDLWAERIRSAPWDRALVFFKHEDGGVGPVRAKALQERLS
ncbi:MAG: DUF72 domain-containing protein [Candidatus Eisenbacteria bacterium]|uniref:DUF72 domain-containing protein n=1 Tax=Eiseniibacteriota bacterium TaxID=2212470 RepID=A0A956NFW9_UNCEI|nr:DUF72 domain-containing protein [Candidatus Eisenbacteria bacterium]MCB9463999.1 DUF72 domain-containing protein [Candidatus Eisenbacteria bacterium]